MTEMRDIRKIRKNGWMTEWTDTCMDGCLGGRRDSDALQKEG